MKKILGILAALIVSTSAVFAGGYKGDLQLLLGAGFDTITASEKLYNIDYKNVMGTGLCTFNAETWHVFGSNDVFKIGFMAAIDEGIGGTMKSENYISDVKIDETPSNERFLAYRTGLFIGAAFSFFLGDVVRFNVAPGLSILFGEGGSFVDQGSRSSSKNLIFTGCSAIGPGAEIQAKFCPNARVSPVLGYRFTANFTNKMTTTGNSSSTSVSYDSVVVTTNTFNLGISWNW